MDAYAWPLADAFRGREDALARLEDWWQGDERMPIALYGRRRVGKSWLFRRFAHGKPAIVLVAEQLAPGAQLDRFASRLEPTLGFRPDIPDVPELFRLLFRIAGPRRLLVVVDEFGWLIPTSSAKARRLLSALQAVMEEERDASGLKLVLCGSTVSQMESLFSERSPLHGRLVRHELAPLAYEDAAGAFLTGLDPVDRFERYAVAGGMPRYLDLLATGSLRAAVSRHVLDRNAPLWNEGRLVVEQELRQPRVHFSLLEQLATGGKTHNELAQALHVEGSATSAYLAALTELRLVRRVLPVGAPATSRSGQWRLDDPFFRFWFRFVFPYQTELESGLRPDDLFTAEVAPAIAHHVAPEFEAWARSWVRAHRGAVATRVGAWWGPALHAHRRSGERSSEEVDVVGMARGRVTVVGEARWTNRRLGAEILHDVETYKLPAMRQAGLRLASDPEIVLFSRSGYAAVLRRAAGDRHRRLTLVDVPDALGR
jgi:hypothetical protein